MKDLFESGDMDGICNNKVIPKITDINIISTILSNYQG